MRLLAVLFILGSTAAPAVADVAAYRVSVPSPDASHVEVSARFTLTGDVIGMYIVSSPDLPDGSAHLVDGLRVSGADGTELAVENLGEGDWKLAGAGAGDAVDVRYRIRLEHAAYSWGPGIDEVAYRTVDGLYFAGRALFVVPFDGLADGATIEFTLPEGWKASIPWAVVDGIPRADYETLIDNCLFLGVHHEETVTIGDFTFVLALGTDLADRAGLFTSTLRPVVPRAQEIFAGMPDRNRYLVVINRGERADGGAYEQSYSMLVGGVVNEASSTVWGHGLVHELLHFWNGQTLEIASPREEWFKEGITDYLTVVLRAQLGQDRPEVTLRKLENALRRVALSRMMMGSTQGLDAAGAEKQRNRMLVYGGGLLAGLALDVELRLATGDTKGLPDLLGALYAEFALEGRPYTVEDVERVASDLAGRDMSDVFDRHVRGGDLVDHGPTFRALGLQVDTFADEFYLTDAPDPEPGALARRAAILGRG